MLQMKTDIFRPLKIGKEVFHPTSFDENSFVMNWTMEAGGAVPQHVHKYMDEHFTITKGEILFTVNGKKIIKKEGEELFIPKGTAHSIKNQTKDSIG
jgi:quercetin dioxygenase-like cupin family protein